MQYPFRVDQGGRIVQQIRADTAPDGWIAWNDRVALGSTYADGVVTPPSPPAPPTPAELEAEVQAFADDLIEGRDRDKAIAMLIADVVAKAFDIPTASARAMVRDRVVAHLRTLRGI